MQNLQLLLRVGGDVVAAVQAERLSTKVPLLSAEVAHTLQAAVVAQLHRTGLTIRLAERLETRIAPDKLDGMARYYYGERGTFYREVLNPLAQEMERTRVGWQEQRLAAIPVPPAPSAERRAALDKAIPLVNAMAPSALGNDLLCDALAGIILQRLSRHERHRVRDYLADLEVKGYSAVLGELSLWVQDACVREGILGWALARGDALNDLAACSRALDKDARSIPALRRRAELYLNRINDPFSALHDVRRLVALEPSPEHWVARATVYIAMGRFDLARPDLTEAIRLEPEMAFGLRLALYSASQARGHGGCGKRLAVWRTAGSL